jgi:2-polyprenyl-6-methoxyphenol hydroxylase-like FAD-dependent oxidoreductase
LNPQAERAPTGETRTIYVVGAGIAGLTLTLALAKFGARVVVLERAPMLSEVGAGLQISPNARKVLNGLGLDRAIAHASFMTGGIDVYPHGAVRPIGPLLLGAAAAAQRSPRQLAATARSCMSPAPLAAAACPPCVEDEEVAAEVGNKLLHQRQHLQAGEQADEQWHGMVARPCTTLGCSTSAAQHAL